MTVSRTDARAALTTLREVVEGHGMALKEDWEEPKNPLFQAAFMESLDSGAKALDLFLTGSFSELSVESRKSLASFCLGDKQAWVVTLSDQTSYLMFRFPTEQDPRSVYLGSRLDKDLRNLDTHRKWKSIDSDAQATLFKERS